MVVIVIELSTSLTTVGSYYGKGYGVCVCGGKDLSVCTVLIVEGANDFELLLLNRTTSFFSMGI